MNKASFSLFMSFLINKLNLKKVYVVILVLFSFTNYVSAQWGTNNEKCVTESGIKICDLSYNVISTENNTRTVKLDGNEVSCLNVVYNQKQNIRLDTIIVGKEGTFCASDFGTVYIDPSLLVSKYFNQITKSQNSNNYLLPKVYNSCIWTYADGNARVPYISFGNNSFTTTGYDIKAFCQNSSNQVDIYSYKEDVNYDPLRYGIDVVQVGGVGSRAVTKTAFYLEEHGYLNPPENYISILFNSPSDLMWVSCKGGYSVESANSSTNNHITIDPISGAGVSIEDKIKNVVTIICRSDGLPKINTQQAENNTQGDGVKKNTSSINYGSMEEAQNNKSNTSNSSNDGGWMKSFSAIIGIIIIKALISFFSDSSPSEVSSNNSETKEKSKESEEEEVKQEQYHTANARSHHYNKEELRNLYLSLIKKYHPDYARSDEDKKFRSELTAKINKAYNEGDVDTLKLFI